MNNVKKILVPIDFSKNSRKLLKSSIDVATKFAAELEIIYVVQSLEDYSGFFVPHMPIAQFEEEMMQSATRKMRNFLDENMDTSVSFTSKVLSGDVAEEIVNHANTDDIGMIVMGTHGYKGLEKVLFGSVAEKVVKTAPCPVLTINPYK